MKFPIVAFYQGNIIFTSDGKAYGVYTLKPVSYKFLPETLQEAAIGALEEPLTGFTGKGQILLLHEEIVVGEEIYLQNCLVNEESEEMKRHVQAVQERLTKGAREKRRYILFELRIKPFQQFMSETKEFLEAMRDITLKNFLGVNAAILSEKTKTIAREAEEEMFLSINQYGMQRAGFSDLNFIVRRAADRLGVLSGALPDRQEGKVDAGLIASFTDGAIVEEKLNYLTIRSSGSEKQYQSYVFVTDMPKSIPLFGYDILSFDLGFPVDIAIHFEIIAAHQASQKVQSSKRFLREQIKEAEDIGDSPEIMEETGLADSKVLAMKTDSGQPLGRMSLCFGMASENLKELYAQTTRLSQKLTTDRFYAVRPMVSQEKALRSFLPGAPAAAPMIECDPGFIAAIGPGFASELGDPAGFHLGWSGMSPVSWSPGRAARELNKTNAAIISGSLGGGKSHLAKLLAYFIMNSGGYVFCIDPKDEYFPFEDLFPGLVRTIELSPRSNTSFNPFHLSKDTKRCKSIAIDYLTRALNAGDNEPRRLAIAEAVEQIMNLPEIDRHMDQFILILESLYRDHPNEKIKTEAEQALYLLKYLKNSDIGSLIFSKETVGMFTDGEKMIVANIKELPRPQLGVPIDKWTEDERQGAAIIFLLAALARETAFSLPREIVKMFNFDESWVLASISEGQRLLDEIIRIGRSFNLIPVLITQNITDISIPAIINNVSQVFCFRAFDSEEVKTNLIVMGADPDAVTPKVFAGLPSGLCLYRDAEGRIGWLTVEPQPSYLNDVFDTKPTKVIEKKAVQYA